MNKEILVLGLFHKANKLVLVLVTVLLQKKKIDRSNLREKGLMLVYSFRGLWSIMGKTAGGREGKLAGIRDWLVTLYSYLGSRE